MRTVRRSISAVLLCASLGVAGAARAEWKVYVSGDLGISTSRGNVSGVNTVPAQPLVFDDSDSDSAPLIGGALGIESPMDEVSPWPLPYDWRLPRWPVRFEVEAVGLRNYEFRTSQVQNRIFITESSSWSFMSDLWLDVPLRTLDRPIGFLFGRTPRTVKRLLEPTSWYLGAGLGVAGLSIQATDNSFTASSDTKNFAWQVGTGIGYKLTPFVTVSAGYRYVDQGRADTDLLFGPNPVGPFAVSQRIHEFRSSLRVNVYEFHVPWL